MRTILLTLLLLPTLLSRPALAAPARPVTMTAFLDKSVYRVGQPIVLEVDLHNPRSQKVAVHNGAYQQYWFQFTLLDSAGRVVPRTARGQEMLKPPPEVYVNPEIIFGRKATRRYRINIADLFLMSPAKSYTLRVSSGSDLFSLPLPAVTAGPFKFRIMEAAASRNAPATLFVHNPNADENIP